MVQNNHIEKFFIFNLISGIRDKMTKQAKVLHKSKSFILGYCSCPCNKEIKIRSKNRHLMRYRPHHHNRNKINF